MSAIQCRAKVTPGCLHGLDERQIYDDPQTQDGTYVNGAGVICDACYIAMGQPLASDPAFCIGVEDTAHDLLYSSSDWDDDYQDNQYDWDHGWDHDYDDWA